MKISDAIKRLQSALENRGDEQILMDLWYKEDVSGLDIGNGEPMLTDVEIDKVIEIAEKRLDAENGLNYDVIKCHIDEVIEER